MAAVAFDWIWIAPVAVRRALCEMTSAPEVTRAHIVPMTSLPGAHLLAGPPREAVAGNILQLAGAGVGRGPKSFRSTLFAGRAPIGLYDQHYRGAELETPQSRSRQRAFPTDEAAMKLLFPVLNRSEKEWTMPARVWSLAKAQFAILFGERFTEQVQPARPYAEFPIVGRAKFFRRVFNASFLLNRSSATVLDYAA